jgi:hypothetical protein
MSAEAGKMKVTPFLAALFASLAASASARGQSDDQAAALQRSDAAAYCRFVKGVADSQSDLEMAPTLFGTAGLVSGADVSPGGSILGPTTRVIAGASYSLSGLYRGIAMRRGAEAECRRYRVLSELHAFLENNKEGLTRSSLQAKLAVLDEALPRADQMLAEVRAALAQARATVEQLDALQLRVDALRATAAETRTNLDSLARLPPQPDRPVTEVLADRDAAEAGAERYEARVRQSRAWDLSVRGGYDRIFGTSIPQTPVFAMATLTLNIGGLLQPGAEERATEGRVAWARSQVEGVDDRVEQAVVRLHAVLAAERRRLDETRVLLADLERRYEELRSVPGSKVAEYADYVWFDLVRTRAEHAYLSAHVADLDRLLGSNEP